MWERLMRLQTVSDRASFALRCAEHVHRPGADSIAS